MSWEITWRWEHREEINGRSGASMLFFFGQETMIVDMEDPGGLYIRFPTPIQASAKDQVVEGLEYRRG